MIRPATIRNCTIRGDVNASGQDGILVANGGATIQDVIITGVGGHGVHLRWSLAGVYERITAWGNAGHGFYLDPDAQDRISYNVFRDIIADLNLGDGFRQIKDVSYTHVERGAFSGNGWIQLGLFNSSGGQGVVNFTGTRLGCREHPWGLYLAAPIQGLVTWVSSSCTTVIDNSGHVTYGLGY